MAFDAKAFHDRVTGILEDEGWPKPYQRLDEIVPGATPSINLIWRHGNNGSAVILNTYVLGEPVRHEVHIYGLLDERWMLFEGTYMRAALNPLAPLEHVIAALRLFRSVVLPLEK